MSLLRELARRGFEVQKFDDYHFRVNGEFDFWFNSKTKSMTWWDRITGFRGRKPEDQMVHFIERRFAEPETKVPHEEFVKRLVGFGWLESEAEAAWQRRQEKSSAA